MRFFGYYSCVFLFSMPDSSSSVLTFGDQRYAMQDLPDKAKVAIQHLQWADAQIRHHEEALKINMYARQALVQELSTCLVSVKSLP